MGGYGAMLHAFTEKCIPHRFDDIPGYDHEYAFWDMELLKFIEWLPRTDAYAGMELRGI